MANGILADQLTNSDLGLKGQTPGIRAGALDTSTLHYYSSINNQPEIDRPASTLDLDGKTPAKYANPETGATLG